MPNYEEFDKRGNFLIYDLQANLMQSNLVLDIQTYRHSYILSLFDKLLVCVLMDQAVRHKSNNINSVGGCCYNER